MKSPGFFCGTPTTGLENLQLQTATPALKIWTLTPTPGPKSDSHSNSRTYCIIVYLRMSWEKFSTSSNNRSTTAYRQSFSCKLNCTKVKQTATQLHKSPDETDRGRRRSLFQMRDSDSRPKLRFQGTPTPKRENRECSVLRAHGTGK